MKKFLSSTWELFVFFFVLLFGFLGNRSIAGASNNVRATNPSAIHAEVGGRALLYSLSIDRVLNDDILVGIGLGTVTMNDLLGNSSNLSATLVPVYLNYYFMREAGSLFATGGATLVTNSNAVSGLKTSTGGLQLSSTPLLPTLGVGYEYRSDPGFLVRVAGYLVVGQNTVPWGGVSIGYSF
jgi:hypothetical protein